MEPDFCSFQVKIALNFKSQGTEKFKLFSQGTKDSQNLGNKTLVIDYEFVKICKKLCLRKYLVNENYPENTTENIQHLKMQHPFHNIQIFEINPPPPQKMLL